MAERRALVEGLKALGDDIDPDLAEKFVYDQKPKPPAKAPGPVPKASPPAVEESPVQPPLPSSIASAAQVAAPSPLTGVGRVPVGARVRTDLASALKRASLERQLQGIQPNSIQEILEEALELWLLKHRHLK
jgi:hypothetical protein